MVNDAKTLFLSDPVSEEKDGGSNPLPQWFRTPRFNPQYEQGEHYPQYEHQPN